MAANKLSSLIFVVSACGRSGARLYGQSAPDDINEGRSEIATVLYQNAQWGVTPLRSEATSECYQPDESTSTFDEPIDVKDNE